MLHVHAYTHTYTHIHINMHSHMCAHEYTNVHTLTHRQGILPSTLQLLMDAKILLRCCYSPRLTQT